MKKQNEEQLKSQIGKIIILPIVSRNKNKITFKVLGQVKGINQEAGVLKIGDITSICGFDPVRQVEYRYKPVMIHRSN